MLVKAVKLSWVLTHEGEGKDELLKAHLGLYSVPKREVEEKRRSDELLQLVWTGEAVVGAELQGRRKGGDQMSSCSSSGLLKLY